MTTAELQRTVEGERMLSVITIGPDAVLRGKLLTVAGRVEDDWEFNMVEHLSLVEVLESTFVD
jgi:hypothetical protein